jgi:hypothetical protein
METELDKIKSTITISLGLKNRIRKLKNSMSYEQFLAKLIRDRNKLTHSNYNYIEIQNIRRKKAIYSSGEYKIIFTYNEYNGSENFIFDISLEEITHKGKKESYENFKNKINEATKHTTNKMYEIYFALLEKAIQEEIEPLYFHHTRIEDYYSWEKEFERLGLSKRSFEFDVMKKLRRITKRDDPL